MSHERFLLLSSVWEKKRKKKLIRLIFLQKIAIILSVKYVYAKLISDFFVIVYQFYPTEVWNIFQVAWKIYSSCRPEAFLKGVLKNFAKFTGEQLCRSAFFFQLPATSLKKRQVFSSKFSLEILKDRFLYRTHLVAASGSKSSKGF